MSDKQYPSNLYLESAATDIDFAKQVSVEAVIVMARELLALRKAFSEPIGYLAEYPCTSGYGGMEYSFSIDESDTRLEAHHYGGFSFAVYRKPTDSTT